MKKILIAISFLISAPLFAQDALEVSLDEAIELALAQNQNHLNAALDVEYARHQVTEVTSMGLPQINGNVNFTHNLEIATQVFPDFISPTVYSVLFAEDLLDPKAINAGSFPAQFGVPYSLQASVGMNQLLFDGTFFLGLKAATEFVEVSKLLLSKSAIDVKEGVIKSYYLALISGQNLEQLEKSMENLRKLREETSALYDAGFAEKLDVDRLELAVSRIEVSINNLKKQGELAEKMLLHSMGLEIDQEIKLSTALPEFGEGGFDMSYGSDFSMTNRIEIKILEQQQVLNEINLKRYRSGYIPNLYLNANYGYNTFAQKKQLDQLGSEWYPLASYGLNLNIPIFDGLYKKSKANQVKVEILKTENSIKQAGISIALEVLQAQIAYQNAYQNLEIQKKQIKLSEDIYETTKIKFQEGMGNSFEMVTAERDLTTANTEYLNALYELNIAKVNLDIALGNL